MSHTVSCCYCYRRVEKEDTEWNDQLDGYVCEDCKDLI